VGCTRGTGGALRGSSPRMCWELRRASSVISRAGAETWRAACSGLSPRSGPRAVFNLLGTVAGGRNSSRGIEFSGSRSPKDAANICASCLRSRFSQQALRLSRGAERGFMNDLRSDRCSDSSLRSTFCFSFAARELATAISGLSVSTTSGPDLMFCPLLAHFPHSAQRHLLSFFGWSWFSHTFSSC